MRASDSFCHTILLAFNRVGMASIKALSDLQVGLFYFDLDWFGFTLREL